MTTLRPARRIARGALVWALAFSALPLSAGGGPLKPGHKASETGRVVVGFERGSLPAAETAAARAGARVRRRSERAGFVVVSPREGESPESLAQRLAETPGVSFAEPEQRVKAQFTPNDARYSAQWNLSRVGASAAWDVERGEASVVVAVLDSGVDLQHPDLVGRLDTVHDYDFITRDTVADDDLGHGTHVAGIIAASTNNQRDVAGIAHRCMILPIRVLDEHGNGTDTGVAEGIRYATDHGVDVINLSLGAEVPSRVFEDAVEYAVSKDVVVVAASGNSGNPALEYPAAFHDVLAVGATGSNDFRDPLSQYGEELDLVAPGIAILSLWPVTGPAAGNDSVDLMTGTSVAAAHVSAAAALVRSAYPAWSAAVVGERLTATARDLGPSGKDLWYGYGMVRADRALGVGTPPPVPPSDDELPGRPLSTSPAREKVDAASDPNDVYAVALAEGHRLEVSLTGSVGATMAVTLIDPFAESLGSAVPLASAVSTGAPAKIGYSVPYGAAGTYRLLVTAQAGSGEYALTWVRGYPTYVSVIAPASCAWGASVYVRARVLSRGGESLLGVPVSLDARPPGATAWTLNLFRLTTGFPGTFRIAVRPSRRMSYRIRFGGVPGELASTSRTLVIWPRAALSQARPYTTVGRNRPFLVAGTLRPEHTVGARNVKITASLKDASTGSWVVRQTVYAVNQDRLGYTRYVGRLTLPRGTWRIVASVTGDDWHAATSNVSYVTVP